MTFLIAPVLRLLAGLHAASYGAYRDSPHESFLLRRSCASWCLPPASQPRSPSSVSGTANRPSSSIQPADPARARRGLSHLDPLDLPRISAMESISETATISPPHSVTYRDLDEVLSMKPSATTAVRRAIPAHVESGFLRAVASLMNESAAAYRESQKAPAGLRRVYVYGGTLYDMLLHRSRPVRGVEGEELESDFAVRNRTTGTTTEFRITYATSGTASGVAWRIVFRPRTWLELELRLKERA